MKNEGTVLYLCGAKGDEAICPINKKPCWYDCTLTTDERYALNGPCKDPENHPERFNAIEHYDGLTYYEERRDFIAECTVMY